MDVFNVHDKLIDQYSEYVQSFLSVADERAKAFVEEKLIAERSLWPDALIQLNPAYEKANTVAQLTAANTLNTLTYLMTSAAVRSISAGTKKVQSVSQTVRALFQSKPFTLCLNYRDDIRVVAEMTFASLRCCRVADAVQPQ